jgi:hypothetical protein
MDSVVWVGFLAFFVAALAVGVRLLALWRRTRQLPELLVAIGVLGIGPVGFGSMVAGTAVYETHAAAATWLFAVGYCAVLLGVLAQYVFNWKVYHASSWLAFGVVAVAGICTATILALRIFHAGFGPDDPTGPLRLSQSLAQVGALLWGSVEALLYWVKMRRRSRLGLADPVVTNRFLLWGIGAGAAGVGTAIGTVAAVVTGVTTLHADWVMASSSFHGFVAAVAMFLAFVPPKAYLRIVQRRAETA